VGTAGEREERRRDSHRRNLWGMVAHW